MTRLTLILILAIPLFYIIRIGLKEKHYSLEDGFWASVVTLVITILTIIISYFI